jgi:hypothetical protein
MRPQGGLTVSEDILPFVVQEFRSSGVQTLLFVFYDISSLPHSKWLAPFVHRGLASEEIVRK